ncbi:MAG: phage tail protein [Myxococcaceae bacterium]|nr:phage tail protein [Myxococcaceae bacterium]
MNRPSASTLFGAALVLVTMVVSVARADGVRLFTPNTPAIADDVNHNFQVVAPTGTIVIYAGSGSTPPDGWLFCDGSAFTGLPTLAAVLGGTTVPDLRGRVVVGLDASSLRISGGAANTVGKVGGVDVNTDVPAHTHTIASDPGHNHNIKAACNGGTCGNGSDGFARSSSNFDTVNFTTLSGGAHNHGGATGSTGSAGVTNLQPFIAFRYIIKT